MSTDLLSRARVDRDNLREEIEAEWLAHGDWTAVAAAMGVSATTLYRVRKELGMTMKGRR